MTIHMKTLSPTFTIRPAYLTVDAESLTGAVRLYERAGMHPIREFRHFEKELRAGRELSTQTVEE